MGIAGKVRPCLLLTDYPELAMVTVLPHTTAVKGNRWESNIPKPFSNSERRYSGILGFGDSGNGRGEQFSESNPLMLTVGRLC